MPLIKLCPNGHCLLFEPIHIGCEYGFLDDIAERRTVCLVQPLAVLVQWAEQNFDAVKAHQSRV